MRIRLRKLPAFRRESCHLDEYKSLRKSIFKTLNKIGVVKTDVLHIKCKLVMENIITYPKLSLRNTFEEIAKL